MTDNQEVNDLTGWSPQKTLYDIVEDIHIWINQNQTKLKGVLSKA
jgi:hypothetical protein